MEYVNLGNSGLKVSKLGLGNAALWGTNPELEKKLVKMAFDNGINYFDTAESYGLGAAETSLGQALKALNVPREDYVVSTKLYLGTYPLGKKTPNSLGTNRKKLVGGLAASLERLQLEYVDLLLLHNFDPSTPTLETVQAMKTFLEQGKILYWGTSGWPVERVMEAIHLADKINCPRPISEQCDYSLLSRSIVEKEYLALYSPEYRYGITAHSILAGGILTGKYNEELPESSRYANHGKLAYLDMIFNRYMGEGRREDCIKGLKKMQTIADKCSTTLTGLSILWTAANPDVSCCLLGAKNEDQLSSLLKVWQDRKSISKEILADLGEIFNNRPLLGVDFRTMKEREPRRKGF